jgi:hypothetical protein
MRSASPSTGLVAVLAFVTAMIPACKQTPSTAECGALVQKYFDLKAQDDPRLVTLPPNERDELARKMRAELMATDPDMRQVTECTNELTRAEYDCAIKAKTTQEWNACIE